MTGKGISPIVDRFLLRNHFLALEFKEGWLFARVVRRRIMHYKPYSLIDAAGNTVNIAAYDPDNITASYQAELRLRDPRNKAVDILFMKTSTDAGFPWILHGAIGWKPHQIFVYPRFPEGSDIPAKFPEIDPIQPSAGNFTGYYSGRESPFNKPTDFMEYVLPPGQHVGHELYNYDDKAHNPVANILFALYHFRLLKPGTAWNRKIRDIALGKPATFLTVGYTSDPLPLGDTLKKDWDAVPITLEDAEALEVL